MRVNVEDKMLSDPRFKQLGQLLRMSHFEAFGRCLPVWLAAQQRRSEYMTIALVDALAERPGFAEAMIETDLAVDCEGGQIRLRGVAARLVQLRVLDQKREKANEAKLARQLAETPRPSPVGKSRGEVRAGPHGGVPRIDQDQDPLSGSGSDSPELPDLEAVARAEREAPAGPVDPGGPRSDRRRKLMGAVWQHASQCHLELKRSGIDKTAPGWPAMPMGDAARELGLRIDALVEGDAPDWEAAEIVIRRRVAVAVAEAKRESRLDWFTPARMWAAKSFEIASAMSPEQAARPRGSRSPPNGPPTDDGPRRFKDL